MINPDEFAALWTNEQFIQVQPEIAKKWGTVDLVRYNIDDMEKLSIPESSKHFLKVAGLPRRAHQQLRFDVPPNTLPEFTKVCSNVKEEYARYHLLGIDAFDGYREDGIWELISSGFICLDEKEYGRVVIISNEEKYPVHLLNSSVAQLAEYLLIFRQHLQWKIEMKNLASHHERELHNQEVVRRLREIDAIASESMEGWGMQIVEIEYGM